MERTPNGERGLRCGRMIDEEDAPPRFQYPGKLLEYG